MVYRLSSLLVIVFTTSICFVQKVKTDLDLRHLKGPVKSIETTKDSLGDRHPNFTKKVLKFNEWGNLTLILEYLPNGNLADSTIIRYNERSKKLSKESYGLTNYLKSKTKYLYGDDGNLTERISFDSLGLEMDEVKYDQRGNELEWTDFGSDSRLNRKWTYTYDDKNLMIESYGVTHGGKSRQKCICKYDSGGHLIEENNYQARQPLYKSKEPEYFLSSKSACKYDDSGNKVEFAFYKPEGSINAKFSSKYDEHNNEIESTYYKPDGTIRTKMTMQFEYDKTGNWVKETIFNNGKMVTVTTRIIRYY